MEDDVLETGRWLDQRYRMVGEGGVYFAHQPIYGIGDANSEPNLLFRYLRTHWILKMLAGLPGHTLLDVGASEGYQASLARDLLHLEVACCDLSKEACKRASEIWQIPAYPADLMSLPFPDNQFDFVVCSETLEHVDDWRRATQELLRVASRAVIITVPREPQTAVDSNRSKHLVHSHINAFDLESFESLRAERLIVSSTPQTSLYMYYPNQLIERMRGKGGLRTHTAKLLTHLCIASDPLLARITKRHGGIGCLLLKEDSDHHSQSPSHKLKFRDILNHTVPHHFLQEKVSTS